ncbi:YHS domain-containing (seleno)protein [Roseibium aestuarii]|uniref:YHS domain-containing (Seleno)protein n=1 Tax=Roseibium aestuarii TaxID=2600299 RepID=A0ABW4JUF4_9HYPH|nr:YHS domain-containing (seleno)protein [Roseibium aestuarii]
MNLFNTLVASATLIAALAGPVIAYAEDEYNVSTGTTVEGQGVALRGLDAVALASGLDLADGQAKFTHVQDGVAYYFASEESMKRFAADPEAFKPQYGGFCALGVALGKKLDGSPRWADVVDGKLYLFLNEAVFAAYSKDKAGTLAKAAETWPSIHHVSVKDTNGLM